MVKPVRLQLSRKRGFSLQALSMATNGLPAVSVARPSKWGNPNRIGQETVTGYFGESRGKLSRHEAINRYYAAWRTNPKAPFGTRLDLSELRGKNLACHCAACLECHADVLLALANGDRP